MMAAAAAAAAAAGFANERSTAPLIGPDSISMDGPTSATLRYTPTLR